MNFLAHLYLAAPDEGLQVGGLLGDFVRGQLALRKYPASIRHGIRFHRWVDRVTDTSTTVKQLKCCFPKDFRRYAGIIIDLAFDHELARGWSRYSKTPLDCFDRHVRELLGRHDEVLPGGLRGFMTYADGRGLFEAYRHEEEMLFSLAGLGTRLKRSNPLHRVDEIWPEIRAQVRTGFEEFFPDLQLLSADWLRRKSMITGS
jgi:acyl carrier protein phosphodiesterase